jgi:predicted MFS family arabinose efflux permease
MGAWYIVQLGGGFYWAPTTAWFSQGLDEAELSKAISKFSRFWLTGSLLGSLAGGMIYSGGRAFMFLFPLLLLLVFLAGLIYYGYHSADGRGDNATGRRNDDGQKNLQIGASYRKKLHLFAIRGWVSGFCGNIITGFLPNIFPLYIRDTLGLTERAAGFILLFRGTAAVLAFTVYAKFTFWHFNRRWFFLVHTGLILFLLLLILPGRSVPLNIIVVFCIGFLYAGANNNSLFHSGADKTNPGKNMAYHEIFTYTGTIAGTLVGGFGYQHFGMFGTLLALAFIETLGLGFQILLERKTA